MPFHPKHCCAERAMCISSSNHPNKRSSSGSDSNLLSFCSYFELSKVYPPFRPPISTTPSSAASTLRNIEGNQTQRTTCIWLSSTTKTPLRIGARITRFGKRQIMNTPKDRLYMVDHTLVGLSELRLLNVNFLQPWIIRITHRTMA